VALDRSSASDGFGWCLMVEVLGVLFVDEGVVISAEETQVVEDSFASVGPEDDVVDVAPSRGPGAPGVGAVTVSGDDSPAETCGYHPGFAADVEDL